MLGDEVVLEDVEEKILVSEELNLEQVVLHLGGVDGIFIAVHLVVLGVGGSHNQKSLDVLAAHRLEEVADEVLGHLLPSVVHVDRQPNGVASVFVVLVHDYPLELVEAGIKIAEGYIFDLLVADVTCVRQCVPLASRISRRVLYIRYLRLVSVLCSVFITNIWTYNIQREVYIGEAF